MLLPTPGLLVAAYLFGWISDRVGRVPALSLGVVLVAGAGVAGGLAPSTDTGLVMFAVARCTILHCLYCSVLYCTALYRFVTGLGAMACFMVSFVLILEQVGPGHAVLVGIGEAEVIARQPRTK